MCILPDNLQNEFLTYKRSIDLHSPILTQGALEIYLKSSMYKFHVQRIKIYYKEKMDLLREECKHLQNDIIKWYIPSTGIYAYVEVNGVSSEMLVNKLLSRGLLVSSTSNCYINGVQHPEGLRLCVCNTDDDTIKRAVTLIGQEVECLSLGRL